MGLHLWNSIANLARTQNAELLNTQQEGFEYIQEESFESTFDCLFSEIDLSSAKLGKIYADRNAKLCAIIQKIAEGLNDHLQPGPHEHAAARGEGFGVRDLPRRHPAQ